MSKKKRRLTQTKKPTKARIDWLSTLIGALVDLAVGILLILLEKVMR